MLCFDVTGLHPCSDVGKNGGWVFGDRLRSGGRSEEAAMTCSQKNNVEFWGKGPEYLDGLMGHVH